MGEVSEKSPINVKPAVTKASAKRVGGFPSIFYQAFAVYGLVDYLDNGNVVARLYNADASTSERNFTAAELTDGSTYTTWLDGANTAVTRVAKLYNQLGDSDLDLSHPSASSRPNYEASENTLRFDQAGYFAYTNLYTLSSDSGDRVSAAFGGNSTSNDTTIVLGARKKDSSLYGLPASGRTLFALRDGFSPTYAYNAYHKALSIKQASYSDDIGITVRDDDGEFVTAFHDVFDHSTLKTYIGEVFRQPVPGVTSTDMNLFVNTTQEVDTNTTDLGNDIDLATILLGDNRYVMKGAMLFNKILTSDEKSELHNRMAEDY